MKSARIRSFSGPYFPAFGPNYGDILQNAEKFGPEKLRIWTLHAMLRRLKKTLQRVNILKHNNCPANIYLFQVNNRKTRKKCELLCEKRCQ